MTRDEALSKCSDRMHEIDEEISTLQKQIYKLKDENNLLITEFSMKVAISINKLESEE